MGDVKAPETYSPAYCSTVIQQMRDALQAAVDALSMANSSQRELTAQAIKHLEESLSEIKKDMDGLEKDQKAFEKEVRALRVKFYAGGISALVFLMGFAAAILKLVPGATGG